MKAGFRTALQRAARALPMALLAIALVVGFGFRARNIALSLPYCRHVDEQVWIEIAWRMMDQLDPNPARFKKPSLPVYTMTAGSTLGLAVAYARGEAKGVKSLGTHAYPFYESPTTMLVTKLIFTSFSVGTLCLLGLLAARLSKQQALLWLTPVIAQISATFFHYSWSYMNVDTMGTFFTLATLLHVLAWHQRAGAPGYTEEQRRRDLIVAGVLSGLTVGSKYNLFPIGLPVALALLFQGRTEFVKRAALYGGVVIATFLVTTPYALITPGAFIEDVLSEVHHYATGHPGLVNEGGLQAFRAYGSRIIGDYAWLMLVGVFGLVELYRRNPRELLLVAIFPVAFFAYMSLQRVVFQRNVLTLHVLVALPIAFGAISLPRLFASALGKLGVREGRWTGPSTAVLAALVVLALVPWRSMSEAYTRDVESRHLVERWLRRNVPKGTRVVIDERLAMDTRRLERRYDVKKAEPQEDDLTPLLRLAKRREAIVILGQKNKAEDPVPGELARFGNRSGWEPNFGNPRLLIFKPQ